MKWYLLTLLSLILTHFCYSQKKVALVIGNAAYADVPLRNPVNDATDMAATLRELGFTVTLKTNLNKMGMETAVGNFKAGLATGDIALFFYSGHGMQVSGSNYLIPVNENIGNETDVRYKAIDAQYVMDYMQDAQASVNIIILDACRDNPFRGARSQTKGFVAVNAPQGTVIAYSTAPNMVALDGTGRNSPYTKNLIKCIQKPGLEIMEVFREVRKNLVSETSNRQIPWESTSLLDAFSLTGMLPKPAIVQSGASIPETNIIFRCGDRFTDPRDSQVYPTVQIGTQCWMQKNMNYQTGESWCYDNNSSNCIIYGRLYNWETALKVCPPGWHLPSNDEWQKLLEILGGKRVAGEKMKSTEGWYNNGNGSNNSGFMALPAGDRSEIGNYESSSVYSFFWTSTPFDENNIWIQTLLCNYQGVIDGYLAKSNGYSCRCIMD